MTFTIIWCIFLGMALLCLAFAIGSTKTNSFGIPIRPKTADIAMCIGVSCVFVTIAVSFILYHTR